MCLTLPILTLLIKVKKKESKVKSSLHDATPSWNGYNYQGFVGIYVCLKLIRNELNNFSFESLLNSAWAIDHTLEYEWLEDFSIKENNNYKSLHQIKHKDSDNFSDHVDAISTILDRKRKILNVLDFNKYLNIQGDRAEIEEEINKIFETLKENGCIDQDFIIVDGFDVDDIDKMDLSSYKYQDEIKIFLMDYKRFASHTFDKSKVYFHTTEGVKKPSQDLNEYAGFKKHKNVLNGKRNLIDFDIFFDFDPNIDYELKLSDDELVGKILDLIVDIINKKEGDTELMSISKDLYFQGILSKVVEHIRYRHIAIRNKIYNDSLPYDRKVDSLKLKDFLDVLNKNLSEKNYEYWNLYCKKELFSIYKSYIQDLESNSEFGFKEEIDGFICNLTKYYNQELCIYANENIIEILKNISCNLFLTANEDNFYNNLVNSFGLKEVFFKFIREIEKNRKGMYYICPNNKKFQPTSIQITSDKYRFERDLELIQKSIYENITNKYVSIGDSDYIVVDVNVVNREKIDEYRLESRNIIGEDDNFNIISDREYKLFSLDSAVMRLKSES